MANIKGNPQTGGRPFQLTLQSLITPTTLNIGPRTESLQPTNTIFGLANKTLHTLKPTLQLPTINKTSSQILPPQPTQTQLQHQNPLQQLTTTTLIKLATINYQLKNSLYPPTKWIIR
ncbi:MAG: hypothetical protein KatS3mg087_0502 [Patescibacteria group bacterium]|nr:MAG: hypothetical protein KatS3mg087_0502 [Patescibacteria group bacterium]